MIKTQISENSSDTTKVSDKQKIQVLIKAVKELRDIKEQLETTNQSLSEQLASVIKEKQDNEVEYIKLIEGLQQQIKILQQNNEDESLPTRISSQSEFIPLITAEKGNQTVIQQMSKEIKQLKKEILILTNNHQAETLTLQMSKRELERELENKETILVKLSKELEQNNLLNNQLKKNIEDIEHNLYNKIIEKSQQNTELQLKIQDIDQELLFKEQEISRINKQIEEFKQSILELEENKGKILQYRLILKNQLLDIDCQFILRQNIYNDYIFELETPAKRFTHKANEITDLKIKDDKTFILSIKSSKNREEIFQICQGQDIKRICKSIKNFLIKVQQVTLQKHNN